MGVKLVLLRHGGSEWNLVNRFTGWTDVALSERGIQEAHTSDEEIPTLNIPTGFPLVYELDDDLQAVGHYYLGDVEKIQEAISSVAAQAAIGQGN